MKLNVITSECPKFRLSMTSLDLTRFNTNVSTPDQLKRSADIANSCFIYLESLSPQPASARVRHCARENLNGFSFTLIMKVALISLDSPSPIGSKAHSTETGL
jgi:hypothetical protein